MIIQLSHFIFGTVTVTLEKKKGKAFHLQSSKQKRIDGKLSTFFLNKIKRF